jgi:hypothetical protein
MRVGDLEDCVKSKFFVHGVSGATSVWIDGSGSTLVHSPLGAFLVLIAKTRQRMIKPGQVENITSIRLRNINREPFPGLADINKL